MVGSETTDLKRALELASKSRKEIVADFLRTKIVSGELFAGTRLNLDEIASDLGVSRMPVREALKQLEKEGLVTFYPYRAVEVATLDASDINELCEIRIALEQLALERALPRITDSDLVQMRALLEELDNLPGTDESWADVHDRFHGIIYRAAGWKRLQALIDEQRSNVQRYTRVYVAMIGTELSQSQHWELYEACCDRDVEGAKSVIAQHVADTRAMVEQELIRQEKERSEAEKASTIHSRDRA